MNKKQLLDFERSLRDVSKLKGVKFAYAVSKNHKALITEIEALKEAEKPSDDFIEYESKRRSLCEEYSEKDKENNPIILNGNYKIIDSIKFETEFKKLHEQNKIVIDNRKKQMKEFNDLLLESVDIKIHKVKIEDLPEDLTAIQINGIEEMIED